MMNLELLKAEVLADGVISDADVELICDELYPDGKIDRGVVELFISLRNEARVVCPRFERLLFDAVKHHMLTTGFIDAGRVEWLR
jgi:hypothetical protein